jgi:hypothetical protein
MKTPAFARRGDNDLIAGKGLFEKIPFPAPHPEKLYIDSRESRSVVYTIPREKCTDECQYIEYT